jgi:hypothetical protein
VFAGDDCCPGHEEKVAGPNGGRVITGMDPRCEVLVTPERKLRITFLDASGKPVAPGNASAKASGGDRSQPTKFTFVVSGGSLVSEQALPAGESLPVILQIKTRPEAKAVTHRFRANLALCEGCKHAEYACTCDSH